MILAGALTTARLTVRPFRQDDVADLVALFADPLVARYVDDGTPLSEEMAALWVRRSCENLERHGFGTGAVVPKDGLRLIGWAGVARPDGQPEEIIYGLGRAHWRRGLGLELVSALTDYAEGQGLSPVRATVHPANAASIALLKRLGFRLAASEAGGEKDTLLYLR